MGKALKLSAERDSHSVQIDWNMHATMNLPAIMINHCCSANVGVKGNAFNAYDFIALRNVEYGEELLWDYEASEYEIDNFSCSCGVPNCRKELRGFKEHGDQVVGLYGEEFIAPYLLKRKTFDTPVKLH